MFHVKHPQFDVVVIGGGHAGCEAAAAAARMGVRTALVTLSRSDLGVMSCNPAIGGLGKGHLVREIDALDGVMGRAADAAGIQFRLLNRRKGPAVQGPRAQTDRKLYRQAMSRLIAAQPNLTVVEAEVADLIVEGSRILGVIMADGAELRAHATVLTSGTFLNGVICIGSEKISGGRMGNPASLRLAARIGALGLPVARLKTGTPPRLDGRTIAWDLLERQEGDEDPVMFSFLSQAPEARQIACGITHTNTQTHDIIRENLSASALYGGHISGRGPRYCPSIEDKILRFADKDSHQIFLEPEGLDDHTVYPNGISTSLPRDIQVAYVRSIRGLEQAEILQPGYAIEYDFVDPISLDRDLQLRGWPGLWLAGQINGTTGYEEAAAQGLVAGLNAARAVQGQAPVILTRDTSYIGVMIDDLVTRGVSEPYRMFTSRAEFRLSLRADNADQRLTPLGVNLGLVGETRRRAFEGKIEALDAARQVLGACMVHPSELMRLGVRIAPDGPRRSLQEALSLPGADIGAFAGEWAEVAALDSGIAEQVARESLYANYISRQASEIETLRRDEERAIPLDFDYGAVKGLSSELHSKLAQVRPATLGQAARIDGMTPAALLLVLSYMRQQSRKAG